MSRRGMWIFGFCVLAWLGLVTWLMTFIVKDEPPPDVSDFTQQRVEIAPEDNALPLLIEAAGLVEAGDDVKTLAQLKPGDDLTVARKVLAENADALRKLDEALSRPALQFEEFTSLSQSIPYGKGLGDLGRLRIIEAAVLFEDGEETRALESLIETVNFGSRISSGEGVLIHWLIGVSIARQALAQLQRFAPASSLTSADYRALTGELERTSRLAASLPEAIRREFPGIAGAIDIVWKDPSKLRDVASGDAGSAPLRLPVHALLRRNQSRRIWAEALREIMDAASHPNSESAGRTPTLQRFSSEHRNRLIFSTNAVGNVLLGIALPVYGSVQKHKSKIATDAQMTSTLLALRAWWLDHGVLPERLDELVPKYLPSVPLDDFDGEPLRYSREKRVLYSIGEDLIDNGGASDPDDKKQQKLEPTIQLDWAMP